MYFDVRLIDMSYRAGGKYQLVCITRLPRELLQGCQFPVIIGFRQTDFDQINISFAFRSLCSNLFSPGRSLVAVLVCLLADLWAFIYQHNLCNRTVTKVLPVFYAYKRFITNPTVL